MVQAGRQAGGQVGRRDVESRLEKRGVGVFLGEFGSNLAKSDSIQGMNQRICM